MNLTHLIANVLVFTSPFVAAWLVWFLSRKFSVPMKSLWFTIPMAMVLFPALVVPITSQCVDAIDLSRAIPNILSEQERQSLQPSKAFCPTTRTFLRHGEKECVYLLDGAVYLGCG